MVIVQRRQVSVSKKIARCGAISTFQPRTSLVGIQTGRFGQGLELIGSDWSRSLT